MAKSSEEVSGVSFEQGELEDGQTDEELVGLGFRGGFRVVILTVVKGAVRPEDDC